MNVYITITSVVSAFSQFTVKCPTMQYHWKWWRSNSQRCSETTTTSSCEALVVVCKIRIMSLHQTYKLK